VSARLDLAELIKRVGRKRGGSKRTLCTRRELPKEEEEEPTDEVEGAEGTKTLQQVSSILRHDKLSARDQYLDWVQEGEPQEAAPDSEDNSRTSRVPTLAVEIHLRRVRRGILRRWHNMQD
jgi:hypothetical protein